MGGVLPDTNRRSQKSRDVGVMHAVFMAIVPRCSYCLHACPECSTVVRKLAFWRGIIVLESS